MLFFAECNLAFAECLRHSAKNLNPVVVVAISLAIGSKPNYYYCQDGLGD